MTISKYYKKKPGYYNPYTESSLCNVALIFIKHASVANNIHTRRKIRFRWFNKANTVITIINMYTSSTLL